MTGLTLYFYRCNTCGKMMKTDESAINHATFYHDGVFDCEYNEDGFTHAATVKREEPVPCTHCGTVFVRGHHNQRYCSLDCRKAARRARDAARGYAQQSRWISKNMTTVSLHKETVARLEEIINKDDPEWSSKERVIARLLEGATPPD